MVMSKTAITEKKKMVPVAFHISAMLEASAATRTMARSVSRGPVPVVMGRAATYWLSGAMPGSTVSPV